MVRNAYRSGMAQRLLLAAFLAGALAPAWAQETAARVIQMTGQVDVLRDNVPWALSMGGTVRPGQVIQTGPSGMATFQVADGSTFEVFPNSRLVFRDNYSNWRDLVRLVLGRIKVHIEKLNGLPNPNRVTTPTAVISVRGTTFDVVIEDGDDTTLVSVEEGEVGVRNHVVGGNEVTLLPGDSVRVYKNQPLARRVDRSGVAQGVLRAAAQAFYEMLYRRSAGGSTPGASGGSAPTVGSGDHGKGGTTGTGGTGTGTGGTTTPAPPPAAPPAPAPPPPPPQ